MDLAPTLDIDSVAPLLDRFFLMARPKVERLLRGWDPARGAPVFTAGGQYTTRGWTEWTQGFMYGAPLLLFEAGRDAALLELGREGTYGNMVNHLTHCGVHDHGFNIVSTYGNLRRLILEGRIGAGAEELRLCETALRVSGAVQARRWTCVEGGGGFIHSFNGPHSLFCDTIRSCRSTALAHLLGQSLMSEGDRRINLLERTIDHLQTTLRYNVYYGEDRDAYDVPGRVAHESLFNPTDGRYRCPSTQQGFAPFSTWTRGLAWVIAGCAEQLELFAALDDEAMPAGRTRGQILGQLDRAARVTFEFYLAHSAADGIAPWDTAAPRLAELGDYAARPSDPYNRAEPYDSSAAAIAAQGFYRLGRHWARAGETGLGERARQAALRIAMTLFSPPYVSEDPDHQGLVLHSVYHRPNGWDRVPAGQTVPCGESSMWGDYHALELAVLLERERRGAEPFTFYQGACRP